ncbi:MAG TPA: hypothetical protein VFW87_14940, partial [Pirellulales bacterium]|nr:hypothetical protein [Pirellulales bacterium]
WVGFATGGEWLIGFFGVHNFGRFVGAMDNHSGPIFYYLIAIAVGFFPWSVLATPTLSHMKKLLGEKHPWRPGYLLACAWIAVWVGFFSLAGTKLPSYIVPAYPALALVTGCFVAGWIGEPAIVNRLWTWLIWGCVGLTGLGIAVAMPVVAHIFLGDEWWLGAIGVVPLVAAATGWQFTRRGQARYAAATLSTLGGAVSIAVLGFAAGYIDRYQESPAFAREIADRSPSGAAATVATFHHFRPSYVFYTDGVVGQVETPGEVQALFADHAANAFVITNDAQFEKLRGKLPPGVTVLDRRKRLLQGGSVLLLGREPSAATAHQASADGPALE